VVRFGKTNWLKGWNSCVKDELFQIYGTSEEGEWGRDHHVGLVVWVVLEG
jgi:hypothetical protein